MFDFNNVLTKEYYPVVVSTNIKYKKQLKMFDTPLGNIKLVDYNHGIMNLKIEIKLNPDCPLGKFIEAVSKVKIK